MALFKQDANKIYEMYAKLSDEDKALFHEKLTPKTEDAPETEEAEAVETEEVVEDEGKDGVEVIEAAESQDTEEEPVKDETEDKDDDKHDYEVDHVKELSDRIDKLTALFEGLVAKVEGTIDENQKKAEVLEFGLAEKSKENTTAEPAKSAKEKWNEMLKGK